MIDPRHYATDPFRARPTAPELIPGLPSENMRRLQNYHQSLASWKAEQADRLKYGLEEFNGRYIIKEPAMFVRTL